MTSFGNAKKGGGRAKCKDILQNWSRVFTIIFAAQNNNIQEAKDYLNKAVSNGFANYKKLQNQEELSILNINEFVEKIKNPQLK